MIKKVTTKRGKKMKKKSTDAVKVHGGETPITSFTTDFTSTYASSIEQGMNTILKRGKKMKKVTKQAKINHDSVVEFQKKAHEPIYQFIAKKVGGKKQKVGVLFGNVDKDGRVKIGWARAKVNHGDKFNPTRALNIAKGRAEAKEFFPICPSLYDDALVFSSRCERYFKQAKEFTVITKQPPPTKKIDMTVLDALMDNAIDKI